MSRHCNVATAKSDEGRNTIDDQTGCKQANKPLCLMAKQKASKCEMPARVPRVQTYDRHMCQI